MVFSANPLALSVPEPAFEAWLRDTGYLEVLDSQPVPPPSADRRSKPTTAATIAPAIGGTTNFFSSALSCFRTLVSITTLNPFAKLVPDDFTAPTPSWTSAFIGPAYSYSWPPDPAQARMRVQENVRRYVRNYAALAIVFFACSLYQMPISLLGLVLCLGLWELLRFCCDKLELELLYPGLRQVLIRITQIAAAVVLYLCNMQMVLICAISVSYLVMILHASLRKLTPTKQSNRQRQSLTRTTRLSSHVF
ncbi:PRA1 family protein H [Dioscorea cayenensis subsp. rotundata]|uniref:PRA1 family protein n=1 Tax=Dioscorea cayennensis subsp. rotundata TaxID=55577 RepID=A0AB40BG21_DIOCR|nr:PRA1 family protein H [Dioscorea cayenensis subsp. rotundata]